MKSATFAARFLGVLLILAVSALGLSFAPSDASAQYSMNNFDEEDCDRDIVDDDDDDGWKRCPEVVAPEVHRINVRPIVDTLNRQLRNQHLGGPVQAFWESMTASRAQQEAQARELARWVDRETGPDMAAGVTPRETTGEWIQRQIQPLRDADVSAWFDTTWSSPRDTHRPTRYDSDIWTLTLGADMPLPFISENLLIGLFGSFTNSDVDTTFNNGNIQSKLGTVGPYFNYLMNEYLAFDISVAGIFGQQENTAGPFGPGLTGSTPRARGEQDVDGFFVSMNANGNYWVGNWGVQGRVGFLHSDIETESYDFGPLSAVRVPGTNTELTQIALATQFHYFMGQGLPYVESVKALPFFRITWNYDLDHDNIQLPFGVSQHPNDDDEVVLNWGVNLFGDGPFSGSVDMGRTFARSRFESWSVSGTVSYAF